MTNPVGFLIEGANDAVGFITDTGYVPSGAAHALRGARILALESNHDLPMLRHSSYPRSVQDRIASTEGHLSNAQASKEAITLVDSHTEHLVAMHISQENNRPSLAVRGHSYQNKRAPAPMRRSPAPTYLPRSFIHDRRARRGPR